MLASNRGFSGSLTTQQYRRPTRVVAQAWNSLAATRHQRVDLPTCSGERTSTSALNPKGPTALPQHQSVPFVFVPHVVVKPAETLAHPPPDPILTGTTRWACDPSPSSPDMLEPQHHSARLLRTAQVWVSPTEMEAQPSDAPTRCGTLADFTDPRPRRLRVASMAPPQHHSEPCFVTAQVRLAPHCEPATDTEAHARKRPTRTGAFEARVVPVPNWPYWLLPQHHSEPLVRMAQA
jgi:hypothetical protein